ncbi:MAG: acetolactate decarboxylase [Synergistaceae bacterium]|nr:acetolactate decarboxylase [Synergistaceae bacterium]
MKKILIAFIIVVLSFNVAYSQEKSDALFQAALLQSLMSGVYDGFITVKDVKNYGDTGIGTFQSVNGELIMLDGQVYQALWDGSVKIADDSETIPFCNVTFFDSDITRENVSAKSISEIKSKLDEIVNSHGKNQFYMAKITGLMNSILVRSELAQEKPYKPLDEALKTDQREFTYKNLEGVVVALYCPAYMNGLNSPGWHLHFVSHDKTKGGHVLELDFNSCKVELDIMSSFQMILPDNAGFNDKDLAIEMSERIKQVENQ